jgi:nitrate reductase NapE component
MNNLTEHQIATISSVINQAEYELIGYQAFYKDGSNKFYAYEEYDNIDKGTASNPLISVKQVGKNTKTFKTREMSKEQNLENKDKALHIGGVSKRFIAITYMIYIILWEALVIGGFGYAVFVLNRSGWWMLLAVLLSASAYKPKSWRKLF